MYIKKLFFTNLFINFFFILIIYILQIQTNKEINFFNFENFEQNGYNNLINFNNKEFFLIDKLLRFSILNYFFKKYCANLV